MKKGWTKWIVILVVVALAVVGSKFVFGNSSEVKYAQTTTTTGSITTYYNFSGNMEVNHSLVVTSPSDTTVAEVYVAANSIVSKNARLMRLDDGTILKANIAGEVTSIDVTADSVVHNGDAVAEIMDMSSMKVDFQVDEYDVSSVEVGKSAQITLDGSGAAFEGTVSSINKRATTSGDLSYYTATVNLAGKELPADALPGMQVTVKLLNKQVENSVLLIMDAVNFTAQNEPYVLMQDGNDVKKVPVEVGINDGDFVEITSGLHNGDTVLYTPTATQTFTSIVGARKYATQ